MSKAGIKQAFTDAQYTRAYLIKQPLKLLKQDYTRIRDIEQKRYKRLKKAGYRTNFTNAVESWGGLPKLSDLKATAAKDPEYEKLLIALWLAEMKSLDTEESTVKYQKKKREELGSILQSHGYNVTESSIDDFGDFMEYLRNTGMDILFYNETYSPSDTGYRSRRVERTQAEKNVINKMFEEWKSNDKTLTTELLRRSL